MVPRWSRTRPMWISCLIHWATKRYPSFTDTSDYGVGHAEWGRALGRRDGLGSFVRSRCHHRSGPDFSTELTKVIAEEPDALYLGGFD